MALEGAREGRFVLAACAGLLRDTAQPGGASWCQLQRVPLSKLLKLFNYISIRRSHNAGVEFESLPFHQ